MHDTTGHKIWMAAVLLLAIFVWMICILLLMECTRQLLDVLNYVVKLAQLS